MQAEIQTPNQQLRRRLSVGLGLGMAMLLVGCANHAPTQVQPPAPKRESDAFAASLVVEQRWLESWFRGTPVVIAQNDDGELIVDVPREFCFDVGGSRIKPALAAVLDKVAESLNRLSNAQLTLLAAPEDKTVVKPLALERAAQLQKHLKARGVSPAQLGLPAATRIAAVQLRIGAVLLQ